MNRIVLTSTVGSDGILQLAVPVGLHEANHEVQITVDPLEPNQAMTKAEWEQWVDSMAGSWQGEFERPPQGEYEAREPLS